MRGYLLLTGGVLAVVLGLYVLAVVLEIPVLTDPVPLMRRSGALAAGIGVGLLSLDVVIPVPSSLVMIAHGALFGVWGGAGLSLLGGAAATLIGFLTGRVVRDPVRRLTNPRLRARAERLLGRWGWLAVLATRPVPVLAETVSVLAGATTMRWPSVLAAGVLGNLVPALAYAWAGATATRAVGGALVFGAVLGLTALAALLAVVVRGRPVRAAGR
ncbi:TVP38/TMEM64 family protein [Kocuria sp. CPCC 205300]|uniref:TVP38/TMEM64 family protein n=1 Tax=Kocuria sabuli TaxID=3071448 RepID=UPI0036DDE679